MRLFFPGGLGPVGASYWKVCWGVTVINISMRSTWWLIITAPVWTFMTDWFTTLIRSLLAAWTLLVIGPVWQVSSSGHCSAAGSVVYNMAAPLHVCNFNIVGLMEWISIKKLWNRFMLVYWTDCDQGGLMWLLLMLSSILVLILQYLICNYFTKK